MQVNPVGADVDGHGDLEEDGSRRVEAAEGGEEAHGGATVRQHVQHRAELRRLVEKSGRVAVHCIKKSAELEKAHSSLHYQIESYCKSTFTLSQG